MPSALLAGTARQRGRSAGGMTLLPAMKMRLASPPALVDLSAIPGLCRASPSAPADVTIGAMTRACGCRRLAGDRRDAFRHLPCSRAVIGDPAGAHRGTIGGSLANTDPAADYPAGVLGLGATIVTDRREIAGRRLLHRPVRDGARAGRDHHVGPFPGSGPGRLREVQEPGVALCPRRRVRRQDRRAASASAVTGAGPSAFRAPEIEEALSARFAPEALASVSVDPAGLNSDMHADSEYRAHLIVAMARRAVSAALAGAA